MGKMRKKVWKVGLILLKIHKLFFANSTKKYLVIKQISFFGRKLETLYVSRRDFKFYFSKKNNFTFLEPLNGSYYDNVTPKRRVVPLPPSYSSTFSQPTPPPSSASKKKCSFANEFPRAEERQRMIAESESLDDDLDEVEYDGIRRPNQQQLYKRRFSVEPNQELSLKYMEVSDIIKIL